MPLVNFYVEVSSTGDKGRDFKLFLHVLKVLRESTIDGHRFNGVHFQQDGGSCIVPSFDYPKNDLPEVELPHGVYRHFGGYGSLEGEFTGDIFGTYQVPMPRYTYQKQKWRPIATIHICGRSLPHDVKQELVKLPEHQAA